MKSRLNDEVNFTDCLCWQAVGNINSLLERADRVYRQLVSHRQPLDLLLNRLLEHGQQEPLQVNSAMAMKYKYDIKEKGKTNMSCCFWLYYLGRLSEIEG